MKRAQKRRERKRLRRREREKLSGSKSKEYKLARLIRPRHKAKMTKEKYSVYLKSKHWKKFRATALKHYDYQCKKCKSREDVVVHHLNYDCLYHEMFEDVMVLCKCCHSEEHGFFDQEEGEVDREFARLIKGF